MRVIHSDEKITWTADRRIFLAGPTPRSPDVKSWRPEALEILDKLNFDGIVLVPEHKGKFDFLDQVEWEWEGLEGCSRIVFWIPRNLETMPAFTTNIEFGSYVRSGRAIYGRPDGCPKNDYLDWLYKKVTKLKPYNDLFKLLREAAK
jgi:hypothetical protein